LSARSDQSSQTLTIGRDLFLFELIPSQERSGAAGCHNQGMLLRCGVLPFLLLTCGGAQNLSVGFAAGGASTNAFETINAGVPDIITSYSQSKDYVVGVMLEYGFAGGLSLEADALYRELHLTVAFVEPSRVLYGVSPSPVVTWELPVMAKYRFHGSKVGPFVEAGPAFRPTTNLNASPSHYGVAAGVGLATRWKQFEITPMVRYTRWTHDRRLENLAKSDSDQVELLPWPICGRASCGSIRRRGRCGATKAALRNRSTKLRTTQHLTRPALTPKLAQRDRRWLYLLSPASRTGSNCGNLDPLAATRPTEV